MVQTIYRGNELTEREKESIWEILCECDGEFFPPLSARESSSQKNLLVNGQGKTGAKPETYYREMIQQNFILAYETSDGETEVVGFMTFKKQYICEALAKFGESLYITTVCVRKEYRNRGVMKALYRHMETEIPKICKSSGISTRTWSLNKAQLHELEKRGYERIAVLKDDRGPGVDTVYFGKKLLY